LRKRRHITARGRRGSEFEITEELFLFERRAEKGDIEQLLLACLLLLIDYTSHTRSSTGIAIEMRGQYPDVEIVMERKD
jgi:hypothetical protein